MTPWTMIEWTAGVCVCVAMLGGTVLGIATAANWLQRRAERTTP